MPFTEPSRPAGVSGRSAHHTHGIRGPHPGGCGPPDGLERLHTEPLAPLALFRVRSFAAAFATAVLAFLAFSGLLSPNTLYLQEVRDVSTFHAGLLTLPLAAATVIAAPLSGSMTRFGPRPPLLIAEALTTAALLLLVTPTAPGRPGLDRLVLGDGLWRGHRRAGSSEMTTTLRRPCGRPEPDPGAGSAIPDGWPVAAGDR
ncbi:MFS transporter [Paractinoplanes brasiliensis]|uniref:MFS transporter n=1 Tax=Paractinoplanes brasiliensis TaxID=52695 RepID=UPI001A37DBA6|nr:MFS transporter [Actinoplanes brasiliensis]GID32405.1 hypothetical protein Abr02nite_73880 [Actinoplanes brasiliensis]